MPARGRSSPRPHRSPTPGTILAACRRAGSRQKLHGGDAENPLGGVGVPSPLGARARSAHQPVLGSPRERASRGQGGDRMSVPTTMRATVLVAPHHFELQPRPVPAPGPEEVLVRVRACGV
jgi:hypothetical protein